jgi:hypothetical protein
MQWPRVLSFLRMKNSLETFTHTQTHTEIYTENTKRHRKKKKQRKIPPIKYKITVFKNGEFRKKLMDLPRRIFFCYL